VKGKKEMVQIFQVMWNEAERATQTGDKGTGDEEKNANYPAALAFQSLA
jgi:hypothetical protein